MKRATALVSGTAMLAVALAAALALLWTHSVMAQEVAYNTRFVTSIAYQNPHAVEIAIDFEFYRQGSATPVIVRRTLAPGAGSSLYAGDLSGLPSGFMGAVVIKEPTFRFPAAMLVQVPGSTTVTNRVLTTQETLKTDRVPLPMVVINRFSAAGIPPIGAPPPPALAGVLVAGESAQRDLDVFDLVDARTLFLPTVLKDRFNTTTVFSVQNSMEAPAVIQAILIPEGATAEGQYIFLEPVTVPAGSAHFFDMGDLDRPDFNGSAVVVIRESSDPMRFDIFGSVVELSTNGAAVSGFETMNSNHLPGKVYMPTALCDAFGGANTSYAAVSIDGGKVTVTYHPGEIKAEATLPPLGKHSFLACDVLPPGFSGSAVIELESGHGLAVVGKVYGTGLSTAFLGAGFGFDTLSLPYVRYTSDENYNAGRAQRTFIAIQNIESETVGPVIVEYRDDTGAVVGTHTFAEIAPGHKVNTHATHPDVVGDKVRLLEFGNPASNPSGQFGGAAYIRAPQDKWLTAIARVSSTHPATGTVGEDYSAIFPGSWWEGQQ